MIALFPRPFTFDHRKYVSYSICIGAQFPKGLLVTDSGGFISLNPKLFRENFAQDVTPAEAEIMAIPQKPFNQSEITAKSGPPARSNCQHGIKYLAMTR